MKILKYQSILSEMKVFLVLPILFILSYFGTETFAVSIYDVTIPPGSSNPSINGFEPATLSIPIGATVKWTNEDSTLHTVTSGSAAGAESGTIFDSSYIAGGKTFEWTFSNVGTFEYYCTLHPFMTGKLIVVNGSDALISSNSQDNQIEVTNPNNGNELKLQQTNELLNATTNETGKAMETAKNILSSAASTTANTTEELMTQANNVLGLASDAAPNATEKAMNKTMKILANISNNAFNSSTIDSPNVTVAAMSNYSSNLYQIQFQYPAAWELNEKTSRFDEGTDISISGFSPSGLIAIQYLNTSTTQNLDFLSAVYDFFKSSIDSDYSKEYKVIEQPSFVTIDNRKAGTYLFTQKDKYEEFATKWASQIWVVYVGNHGYLLSFMASTNVFDSPEVKNTRDQFIQSIKFLGVTNEPQSSVPNRFD